MYYKFGCKFEIEIKRSIKIVRAYSHMVFGKSKDAKEYKMEVRGQCFKELAIGSL
jgi:hypothetical protein